MEDEFSVDVREPEAFFGLAERFGSATDPNDVNRLGDQLGRMV